MERLNSLSTYGYAALFACVLAEQLGLPLPAAPFLLAAGALAGLGKLNLAVALLLAVVRIPDRRYRLVLPGKDARDGSAAVALQDLSGAGRLRSPNKCGVLQTRNALVVVRQIYPGS